MPFAIAHAAPLVAASVVLALAAPAGAQTAPPEPASYPSALLAPVPGPASPDAVRMTALLVQLQQEQRNDLVLNLSVGAVAGALITAGGFVLLDDAYFHGPLPSDLAVVAQGLGYTGVVLGPLLAIATGGAAATLPTDGEALAVRFTLLLARQPPELAVQQADALLAQAAALQQRARSLVATIDVAGGILAVGGGATQATAAAFSRPPSEGALVGVGAIAVGVVLLANGVRVFATESPAQHALRVWRHGGRPDAGAFAPMFAPVAVPGGVAVGATWAR